MKKIFTYFLIGFSLLATGCIDDSKEQIDPKLDYVVMMVKMIKELPGQEEYFAVVGTCKYAENSEGTKFVIAPLRVITGGGSIVERDHYFSNYSCLGDDYSYETGLVSDVAFAIITSMKEYTSWDAYYSAAEVNAKL